MVLKKKFLESENQVLNDRSATYMLLELERDEQSVPNVNILTQIVGIAAAILLGWQTAVVSICES